MTVPFQVFEEARGLKQGATQVEVEHLIFGSSEIRTFRVDHRYSWKDISNLEVSSYPSFAST